MSAGSLQELEGIVDLPDRRWDLQTIAEAIPLVRAFSNADGQLRFRVHAMAQAVFACPTFASLLPTNAGELRLRVMGHLSKTARYPRLQTLLTQLCAADEITDWLEDSGKTVLLAGELGLLRCALARVPQTVSVNRPRLLLLRAALLRETGEYADALRQARVVRDVAEHEGERQLLVESMLLIVRLAVDTGDAVTTRDVSLQLLSFVEHGQRALACSYLAAAAGWLGDAGEARAWG